MENTQNCFYNVPYIACPDASRLPFYPGQNITSSSINYPNTFGYVNYGSEQQPCSQLQDILLPQRQQLIVHSNNDYINSAKKIKSLNTKLNDFGSSNSLRYPSSDTVSCQKPLSRPILGKLELTASRKPTPQCSNQELNRQRIQLGQVNINKQVSKPLLSNHEMTTSQALSTKCSKVDPNSQKNKLGQTNGSKPVPKRLISNLETTNPQEPTTKCLKVELNNQENQLDDNNRQKPVSKSLLPKLEITTSQRSTTKCSNVELNNQKNQLGQINEPKPVSKAMQSDLEITTSQEPTTKFCNVEPGNSSNNSQRNQSDHINSQRPLSMPLLSNDELTPIEKPTSTTKIRFTVRQLLMLEEEYKKNKYLSYPRMTTLNKQTRLTSFQIKFWFENRRSKDRKKCPLVNSVSETCNCTCECGCHAAYQFKWTTKNQENPKSEGNIYLNNSSHVSKGCGCKTLKAAESLDNRIAKENNFALPKLNTTLEQENKFIKDPSSSGSSDSNNVEGMIIREAITSNPSEKPVSSPKRSSRYSPISDCSETQDCEQTGQSNSSSFFVLDQRPLVNNINLQCNTYQHVHASYLYILSAYKNYIAGISDSLIKSKWDEYINNPQF